MRLKGRYLREVWASWDAGDSAVGSGTSLAYEAAKRAFDVCFGATMLVGLSPLMLVVVAAIRLDSPGPCLFSQDRVGKDGRVFRFYKFRTMVKDAEELQESLEYRNEREGPAFKIANDPRVTRVGKLLRRTSLDELPQFWNVLRGEMSVVGPRPALPREVECYTERQKARLSIRPGITCYWQVRGDRDSIGFDEWIDLDLLYIRQRSVLTDLAIIAKTVGVVLSARGS